MQKIKEKITLGIDVSKDKLDVWYHPINQHKVVKNNARQIGQWLSNVIKTHTIDGVALEPTGGYEKLLTKQLVDKGLLTYFIHPNKLKHFQKAQGPAAKTDKIAACELAKYAVQHAGTLKAVSENYVMDKALTELSHRVKQLKKQILAEGNRLEKVLFDKKIAQSIKRHIKFLKAELDKMNQNVSREIQKDETKQHQFDLIQTFKGAGPVVATTLVLDVPELGQLSKAQVSRLIGLAPMNQDSGQHNGHRYIQGGRATVRHVIYMAALATIKHNHTMRLFYNRLRLAGKPAKVAIVAVMRKMIITLNAMVRDKKPWQEINELVAQNA